MEAVSENALKLPPRPWILAGEGFPCLIQLKAHRVIPVFHTSQDARDFLAEWENDLPSGLYPHFPDENEFVTCLGLAMSQGTKGYLLVEEKRWIVIPFAEVPIGPHTNAVG